MTKMDQFYEPDANNNIKKTTSLPTSNTSNKKKKSK